MASTSDEKLAFLTLAANTATTVKHCSPSAQPPSPDVHCRSDPHVTIGAPREDVDRDAEEEEEKNTDVKRKKATRQLQEEEWMRDRGSSSNGNSTEDRRRRVSFSENIKKSVNERSEGNSKKLIKTRSLSSSTSKPPILAPKPFFVTGRSVKSISSVVDPKFCSKSSRVCERTPFSDESAGKAAPNFLKQLAATKQREKRTATSPMPNELVAAVVKEETRVAAASKRSDVAAVISETAHASDDDEGEPAAFTSVSARRGKFEQMNGNHSSGISTCDTTTVTAANPTSPSPLLANAAKTLFKDILQMKDLNGLEKTKQKGRAANPLKQHADNGDGDEAKRNGIAAFERSDASSNPQQSSRDRQEEEDDWFKNIPLPPQALQSCSPPPHAHVAIVTSSSTTPPVYNNGAAAAAAAHSSVTSSATADDDERIAGTQSSATDQSKQCGNNEAADEGRAKKTTAAVVPAPPIPPKGGSAPSSVSRSLEEEILYYDNMDIMEKVREQTGERGDGEAAAQEPKAKKEKPTAVRDEKVQVISRQQHQQQTEESGGDKQNKSDYELHQAIGKLEEQFNKLTKQMASIQDGGPAAAVVPAATAVQPPKLPPKQHRFNRQQTINKQQVLLQQQQKSHERVTPAPPQSLDERFKIHQQLLQQQQRKKEELANLQRQQQKRESDERRQQQQQQQTEKKVTNLQQQQQQAPLTSPRPSNGSFFSNGFVQCSPEDVRARALVDEPLAPIIEEESVCGDSSCTSSVTGDDFSTQADSYSCVNGTASLAGSSTWSPASSRRVLTDEDAGATETEGAEDGKTPSDGELSDADSVRWQSNPISSVTPSSNTKVKKKISFSTADDFGTIRRRSSKDQTKSGSEPVSSSRRPSQDSVHSWKDQSSDCTIDDNESTFSDVAPYGMVDLTKFEPTYQAEKKQTVPDEVLTPHSILTSVQDFNSTLHRHRGTNCQSRSAPDESELPSFPLQINNDPANHTNPWSKTLKKKKLPQKPANPLQDVNTEDGIGYDNLENYGGEDRRAAKQQQSASTIQKNKPVQQQQQQQSAKPIETTAEKPTPKPRELANVTASRLARHSSAVTALDRHSNNLKRNNKQPVVIKQQKQAEKQAENKQADTSAKVTPRSQEQSTNSRRRNTSRSSTSSEASTTYTEGREHLEGRVKCNNVRVTRQSSTTSSLSDTQSESRGSSLQSSRQKEYDEQLVNPYEEVSLIKTATKTLTEAEVRSDSKDQTCPEVEASAQNLNGNNECNGRSSTASREINGLEDLSKRSSPSSSSQSLVEVTDTTSTKSSLARSASKLFSGDQEDQSSEDPFPPQPAPRSIGSQLRNFLSGNPENKYISPSLRRKRSLLKRSKSPGGSRRSRTPPRSKSSVSDSGKEAEEDTVSNGSQRKEKRSEKQRNKVKEEEHKQEEEEEAPKEVIRKERSASQRLVDRRGRSKKSSFRRSEGDLEKKGENEEKKKKMGSRWRRSKSQDRVSPTRSKSKDRKLGRSKSTERPMPKEGENNDPNNTEEERGRSRSIFKRSRSSSRKRDGRGKSSERKEDGGGGGGRGRNPVSFFRKLLKKRESENEEEPEEESIIQVPLGETRSRSGSSEALSTILAYKNSDTKAEKGSWTPPRPSSSVQRAINNNSPRNTDKHKSKKSPTKHRKGYIGPSAESFAACRRASQPHHQSLVRRTSLTNSGPSSDSDNYHRTEAQAHPTFMQKRSLRRKLLLAREYDSDTSALASDIDSSLRPGLDSTTIKSSLRKPKRSQRNSPRRPVRVVSPRRSQSEPTLLEPSDHTYYNLEGAKHVFRFPPSLSGNADDRSEEKNSIKSRVGAVENHKQPSATVALDVAYATHQRKKYKILVSLNAQTLKKITERRLAEWRNQLPVGGFLITSWSDVALSSHRPLCMIGNSVVYGAVSNGNNKFNLACQLYEYRKMDNKILQKIESCTSLAAHPNVCGVCSHFVCRVPRSLLDPSSGGGAADAICIVLSNRPKETIEDNLERILNQGDSTEYHRQILLTILQLIQGVHHLFAAGFQLPPINADQIISTVDHGFAQILPHLAFCDATTTTTSSNNKKHKRHAAEHNPEPEVNGNNKNTSAHTQQLAQLIKRLLQKGAGSRPGDRSSTSSSTSGSRVVVPGTKYSSAIKHTIQFLQRSITSGENLQRAAEVIQCALWGPEDLDDVGIDDVTPLVALELWVEMEQAKLVNSLAVLSSGDRLTPVTMMKHRFFAVATPQMLLDGLKILQRI